MQKTWPVPAFVLLLACGLAGFARAAIGADDPRSASGSAGEPDRQVWYSPRLLANISVSERYVVIGVCEADGIREIAGILRRSDFEEMWAFLPRAHGSRDCQWHEIGREEKSETDSAFLRVDMAYLEALMAENPEIHVIHFHPLKYFECAAHPGCPRAAPADGGKALDPRWITDLIFSMPSPSDVHFMMDVTSRYHRRRQGRGTIKHKVVTPYGVVDYGLTDAGLAKFDSERFGRSEGLYITWVMAGKLANDHVEDVIKENPGSIDDAVRRLAHTLNNEFLRVAHGTLKQAIPSQAR